jgi:cold shock CspA family protein
MLIHKATVANWNEDRGFGFIRPDDPSLKTCGRDLFAHATDCHLGNIPRIGAKVEFVVVEGRDGRPKASRVTCV